MKDEYVILHRDEADLILCEIQQLKDDIEEILMKKKLVFNNDTDCSIRFDSSFLMSKSANELFSFTKE